MHDFAEMTPDDRFLTLAAILAVGVQKHRIARRQTTSDQFTDSGESGLELVSESRLNATSRSERIRRSSK